MISVDKNEVGQKIRSLRKRTGLTQKEFARKIGLDQSFMSRMENGEYQVTLVALAKILVVFDMKVGEFFGVGVPLGSVESALIDAFRRLNKDSRASLLRKARKLKTRKVA